MRAIVLSGLVLAVVLGGAGSGLAQEATDDSAAHGRDLVLRTCSQCHAVGFSGNSPNPAAPPFRELGKRYPIDNLGEALAEGILVGHPLMPEFKFPPADIDAILDYLNRIQVKGGAGG